jgi:hypothetical protein
MASPISVTVNVICEVCFKNDPFKCTTVIYRIVRYLRAGSL